MAAARKKTGEELEKLGFHASGSNQYHFDHLQGACDPTATSLPTEGDELSIVSISNWQVAVDGGKAKTTFFELEINIDCLKDSLEAVLRDAYSDITRVEFRDVSESDLWVICEFDLKQQSRHLNNSHFGFGGFHLSINFRSDRLYIGVSDHFSLGRVPSTFLLHASKWTMQAFAREELVSDVQDLSESTGIFGTSISVSELVDTLYSKRPKFLLDPNWNQMSFSIASGAGRRIAAKWSAEANYSQLRYQPLPFELMEAIELKPTDGDMDKSLLEDQNETAIRHLVKSVERDPQNSYALRRLMVATDHPVVRDYVANVRIDLDRLSGISTVTALAFHAQTSLSDGKDPELLDHLSAFGQVLTTLIPEADLLECLDFVLPVNLGLAWMKNDADMAEKCFKRVSQKRGVVPDVQLHLAEIARKRGELAKEVDYLEQILTEDLSTGMRRRLATKILEARWALGETVRALEFGVRSNQADPGHHALIPILCQMLVENGDFELALDILKRGVQSSFEVSPKFAAQLEVQSGKIWLDQFQQSVIARRHFEAARELHPENTELLPYLEGIYRDSGESSALVQVLNEQYRAVKDSGSQQELRRIKNEIIDLYSGELSQFEKAFELLVSSKEVSVLDPDEMAKLIEWDIDEVEWSKLYEVLAKGLETIKQKIGKAKLHANLAEVCRIKLGNRQLAATHLKSAAKMGYVDPAHYDQLVDILRIDGDYKLLKQVLVKEKKTTPRIGKD